MVRPTRFLATLAFAVAIPTCLVAQDRSGNQEKQAVIKREECAADLRRTPATVITSPAINNFVL